MLIVVPLVEAHDSFELDGSVFLRASNLLVIMYGFVLEFPFDLGMTCVNFYSIDMINPFLGVTNQPSIFVDSCVVDKYNTRSMFFIMLKNVFQLKSH